MTPLELGKTTQWDIPWWIKPWWVKTHQGHKGHTQVDTLIRDIPWWTYPGAMCSAQHTAHVTQNAEHSAEHPGHSAQ